MRSEVVLWINGQKVSVSSTDALTMLSDFLRKRRRLTGTKVVCAEGDCGACTVMISSVSDQEPRFRPVNACIIPTVLLDAHHIITVEGLAQEPQAHPVQKAMVQNFGAQCGFCTPGFVMALTSHFDQRHNSPDSAKSIQKIKNSCTGNLCRCTGYQPIIESAQATDLNGYQPLTQRYATADQIEELTQAHTKSLGFELPDRKYYSPSSVNELNEFLKATPQAQFVSAGTDLGVRWNKGAPPDPVWVGLNQIPDLHQVQVRQDEIRVGAKVNYTDFQKAVKKTLPDVDEFLNIFASPQIKNWGTLVGNIANASPIADTAPFLLALDSQLELEGPQGARTLPLDQFYLDYKKTALRPSEWIRAITIPIPDQKNSIFKYYKISQRRDLDISCVNLGLAVQTDGKMIKDIRAAAGGVGPIPLRLTQAEQSLIGQAIDRKSIAVAKQKILDQITPISDLRGSDEFRKQITGRLWQRFWDENFPQSRSS